MPINKQQIALVTGSSSGIGRAIALKLAHAGYFMVVHSKSNVDGGLETVADIENAGGNAMYLNADLTSSSAVEELFDKIANLQGSFQLLVNNAGRTVPMDFELSTEEYWFEQFQTNFFSVVFCSQRAAKLMQSKSKGSIINIASIRGLSHGTRPGIMAYCAAKAAVINFTKSLAKHLAPHICVNAVAPGIVETPYLSTVDEQTINQWREAVPIQRFLSPDEIAEAVLFFAKSNCATGEVMVLDGGMTL